MCFSISVQLEKNKLEKYTSAKFKKDVKFSPFYFKSAFENPVIPAICSANSSTITAMEWGLIPHWITTIEEAIEIRTKTYNARVENIFSKPSFKYYSHVNRCIIPVSGFFEWQHVGKMVIPWYIFPKSGTIFQIAGIWSNWTEIDSNQTHSTFTIITQPANKLMSEIHSSRKRMPVILDFDNAKYWLSTDIDIKDYNRILVPISDTQMCAHTISPIALNAQSNRNIPEIVQEFTYPSYKQLSIF